MTLDVQLRHHRHRLPLDHRAVRRRPALGRTEILKHGELLTDLPYGWIGVIASLHFGIWYYLGIEGTCQAAEEVRSPGRALPLGTMSGMITLLIAATLTWYVAVGVLPWEYVGWDLELAPLYRRRAGDQPRRC